MDSGDSRSDGQRVRYAASFIEQDVNDPRVKCLEWIRPGSRVLEIGCGYGAVTRLLHERLGCSVVAVDLNPESEQATSGIAERFVCGDISEAAVRSRIAGSYDYVLLMDVLEHTAAPDAILQALVPCVGADAAFVITLPNFVVWHVRWPILLGQFRYEESGTLDRTHLRFFSLTSAQSLLRDAGFEIEALAFTWNVPWLGSVWSFAQVGRIANLEEKVRRRFARSAALVMGLIRTQERLNRLGWPRLVNGVGQTLRGAAPGLFTNHIAMLATPARLRTPAQHAGAPAHV